MNTKRPWIGATVLPAPLELHGLNTPSCASGPWGLRSNWATLRFGRFAARENVIRPFFVISV